MIVQGIDETDTAGRQSDGRDITRDAAGCRAIPQLSSGVRVQARCRGIVVGLADRVEALGATLTVYGLVIHQADMMRAYRPGDCGGIILDLALVRDGEVAAIYQHCTLRAGNVQVSAGSMRCSEAEFYCPLSGGLA